MSYAVTVPGDTGLFSLPPDFALERGGTLRGAHLAYTLSGPDAGPVVAVLGGISAGRHVRAWWPELVGHGLAIDTDRVRVLGIDPLGGCGASSGPVNASEDFPAITPADVARALAALLDDLGGGPVTIVGASFGGMVGLALAAERPDLVGHLVAVSAPARSHPRTTGWRCVQRRIVDLGLAHGAAHEAMEIARGLAMTGYRTDAEFAERFDAPPRAGTDGGPCFAVDDYLRARGADFAARFDARAFLRLSLALDLHDVDPSRITSRTTLVAVRSDGVVPVAQIRALADAVAGPTRLVEIDSKRGHDAFLVESAQIDRLLREVLR